MATTRQVRVTSQVERCRQQVFGTWELEQDPDGDYPYRHGTAACWVRVMPDEPLVVGVFAHAAHGVRRTAKLLNELNDINTRTATAHVYFSHGLVLVEQVLHPAGVSPETLSQACGSVAHVADDIGHLIASVHGGATPLDPAAAEAGEGDA